MKLDFLLACSDIPGFDLRFFQRASYFRYGHRHFVEKYVLLFGEFYFLIVVADLNELNFSSYWTIFSDDIQTRQGILQLSQKLYVSTSEMNQNLISTEQSLAISTEYFP